MTRKKYIRLVMAGGIIKRDSAHLMAWMLNAAGIPYAIAWAAGANTPWRVNKLAAVWRMLGLGNVKPVRPLWKRRALRRPIIYADLEILDELVSRK